MWIPTRDRVGKPGTGGSDKGGVKKLGTAQTEKDREGGRNNWQGGGGGVRKMREGVNNQGRLSKGAGRVGGVGATVGGQINKGGWVKKVGHCSDTGKEQGVKKKGGGVRKKEGGGSEKQGGGLKGRGGVGATVGGQINKGGGVKKVGHCTDTVQEQGVKKKGGGVRKIRGG